MALLRDVVESHGGTGSTGALPEELTSDLDALLELPPAPALRALQTAEVFGLEPTVDERWHEMAYGSFEGMAISDVPAEQWQRWITEPDYAPEGGESLRQLGERVRAACDDLLDEARERHIVVVTHATPVKVAMAWALGVDERITWRSFVDQASVTRIIVRDRGPALAGFNTAPHLLP